MFLVGILSWWYGRGWLERANAIKSRLRSSMDFFSIGLLLSTLFAPFRQISAGQAQGSLDNQMHAFFDKLLSRFIGAFMRIFMIIIGLVVMASQIVYGFIVMIVWPIVPLVPVIGLIAMAIGWVPQWIR